MSVLYVVDGDKAHVITGRNRDEAVRHLEAFYRTNPTTPTKVRFLDWFSAALDENLIERVDAALGERDISRTCLLTQLLTAWLESK